MRTVFVATAATGHFDFLAIGASRAEAIGALLDAWRAATIPPSTAASHKRWPGL